MGDQNSFFWLYDNKHTITFNNQHVNVYYKTHTIMCDYKLLNIVTILVLIHIWLK